MLVRKIKYMIFISPPQIRLQADLQAQVEAEERLEQSRNEQKLNKAHEVAIEREKLWRRHREKDEQRKK
jgi:hypothetical protein